MARRAYHHGDLPRAVMAAALEDLESGDRFAVNINRIARELEVSHAAVYRHFPTKQALLDAVARSGFEQLTGVFESQLAPLADAPASERLRVLARTYVGFVLEHPMLTRVMFSGAAADRQRDPELREASLASIMVLHTEVARSVGEAAAPPDDVASVTLFFWAAMHGLAMLSIEAQLDGLISPEDFETLVEQAVTWLARGVTPQA